MDSSPYAVLGGTRFGRDIHQGPVRQIVGLEPDPRFVFNLGDMVNDGESASEWKAFFEDVYPLARFIPYHSALGSHERDAVVTGGGGTPLHELGPPTGETVVQLKAHHYTLVTVSPEQLEVVAVDAGGQRIDSLVRKAGGP